MNRTSPILFVWVPLALGSGVGSEGSTLIYHLLVILAACLMLEKILVRRDWGGTPSELDNPGRTRGKRREK